ncbi:MAG: hypothetical protein AB7K52_13450 [Phycisphaerales bacterium]
MPCLLTLLAFISPRLVIVLLAIFSDYLGRAYGTVVWPIVGFFLAPTTTLAVAFSINQSGGVQGWYIVLVAMAVLFDLSAYGGTERIRRGPRRNVRVRREF